jgi:hypothetical protein
VNSFGEEDIAAHAMVFGKRGRWHGREMRHFREEEGGWCDKGGIQLRKQRGGLYTYVLWGATWDGTVELTTFSHSWKEDVWDEHHHHHHKDKNE